MPVLQFPIPQQRDFSATELVVMDTLGATMDAVNDVVATPRLISPLMLIYFVGTALLAIFFTILYARNRKEFMTSLPVQSNFIANWLEAHKLKRRVSIRVFDKITAPLTYGIFRPVILLPKDTDWVNEKELQHILVHELVHIRRFDALTKLVMTAALCLHWFNPIVWAMYFLFNRDMEISCDETVVQTLGEPSKQGYALTLLGMVAGRSYLPALYNNFSKYAIEERIDAIMNMKKGTIIGSLTALMLVTVLAASTLTVFASTSNGNTITAPLSATPPLATPLPAIPQASSQSNVEVILDSTFEPSETSISIEEAMQIGIEAVERFFNVSLDGERMYMSYSPRFNSNDIPPRLTSQEHAATLAILANELGMTTDELVDAVMDSYSGDGTGEFIWEAADSLGMQHQELRISVMYVRAARAATVFAGWATERGMTTVELFDYIVSVSTHDNVVELIDSHGLGVTEDEFRSILSDAQFYHFSQMPMEPFEVPSTWDGLIMPEGMSINSIYDTAASIRFSLNAENGDLLRLFHDSNAASTIGIERPERTVNLYITDFEGRTPDGIVLFSEELTDLQISELTNYAAQLATARGILPGEIDAADGVAWIGNWFSGWENVPAIFIVIQDSYGNYAELFLIGFLEGQTELVGVVYVDGNGGMAYSRITA